VAQLKSKIQNGVRIQNGVFEHALRVNPIGAALEAMDGRLLYVNPALSKMLGFTEEELLSKQYLDFSPADDTARDWELFEQLRAGLIDHYQIDKRYFCRNGIVIWGRLRISLLNGHPSPLVLATVEDITELKRTESALRDSETQLRSLFREAGIGMVVVSPEGRFLSANPTFCDYLGYTEQELLTMTVESITFPDDWPAFAEKMRGALRGGRGFQWLRKRCLHKSGRIVYTETSASVIRDREGDPQFFVGQVLDITSRKKAEEALLQLQRMLRDAQEQERMRISRELHDDINQRLAMLTIEIDQLQIQFPKSTAARNRRLGDLKQRLIDVSSGVQSLSHQLHPSQLQYLGLVGAMRSFCQDFSGHQGTHVDFTAEDVPKEVPYDLSLCLFRVLQEAVHNAAKHGKARNIEVTLSSSANELRLVIADNGHGFDADKASTNGGLGLISMRERMRLVDGKIAFGSVLGSGTTVRVSAPLPPPVTLTFDLPVQKLG
jgi:PAS domain S-box-containing protein